MSDICEDFEEPDSFHGASREDLERTLNDEANKKLKTPEELAADMERRERLQGQLFANVTPPVGYAQKDETWTINGNNQSLSAAKLEKAREYLTKISHLHVPYEHKSGSLILCAGCLAMRALEETK